MATFYEPSIAEFPRVAVLAKRGKFYQADAAFGDENSVFVSRKLVHGAKPGELVILKPAGRGRGEVVRRLGKADSLPAIMEGIFTWYGVPRGFSQQALVEAEERAALAEKNDASRRDLTSLASFTIDPDEARDFDDAISLVDGPGEGELTLFVHIADVSYFVPAGSTLDREAARKAVSVYLPLAVEPMLPEVLSSDACSLRPNANRKCITVEMVFGGCSPSHPSPIPPEPVLKRSSFYRSLIRSCCRLSYNQVDDYFQSAGNQAVETRHGEERHHGAPLQQHRGAPLTSPLPSGDGQPENGYNNIPSHIGNLLNRCRDLAAALRAARYRRGALAISTFEPEFRLSKDGDILSARPRPESESHALIEEFMIAANETVARFLERRQSNCIYRVHEEPDAAAVDALFDMLEDLGIPTPPFSLKTGTPEKAGRAIRELLQSLPKLLRQQQRSYSAFSEIVLRSLKQARYLEDNLGHYGLASSAYLHFTSPIRRYPDLAVHRALLKELHLEDYTYSRIDLAEIAQKSSEAERRAAMVEHAGDDVALAYLLDRKLFREGWDRCFEGEIISVISSGLFVRFEHVFEGYVPARCLQGDYFVITDTGGALVGRRSGRTWRLGDKINVRVVKIDKLRGKAELEPASR